MARGNHPFWDIIEGKEPSQGVSSWLGRKILEGKLEDTQGKLIATATATSLIIKMDT